MPSRYQEGVKKTEELQDLKEEEEQKTESPEDPVEEEETEEEEKEQRSRLETKWVSDHLPVESHKTDGNYLPGWQEVWWTTEFKKATRKLSLKWQIAKAEASEVVVGTAESH